ncbi:LOW QUALITY PROTEIN: hypothetical protein Cgig2_026282 [Carnegiea gigantea]|uniref:Myb/SANT-like domain-containing protein n=1 Tax=Carnegiea gigantea TaxID=171969 RepID=A0A9Q1JQR0_9CARY|nr:LOW QUALITY PROTEIN: hypothetical protein Cgig2_026282 [Carnegiea gigantea]
MALENNETKKGGATKEFFKWCYDETLALCDVIVQYIMTNGHNLLNGMKLKKKITQRVGHQRATNYCKHKYDVMRKDWNPILGKITASAEWWDKKIKENQSIKKFRDKGVSLLLEEKWEHICEGTYAIGENDYVLTMEPPIVNVEEQGEGHESKNNIEGRLGEEDNLRISSREDQFFTHFVECLSNGNDDNTKVNSEDGPSQVNNQLLSTQVANQARTDRNLSRRAQKFVLKTNTMQLKHNRRQLGGLQC